MSYFCSLNGIRIPVMRDSWEETIDDIGDAPRDTIVGSTAATRVGKKRRWRFRTPPLPPTTIDDGVGNLGKNVSWKTYERLIEGFGANWQFEDFESISGQCYTNSVAGSFTKVSGSPPVGGSVLRVSTSSRFGSRMSYRMGVQRSGGWSPTVDGWTMMFWKLFVSGETYTGWRDCVLTGAVDFARGSSANPSGVSQYVDHLINAAANLGNCVGVSASSPYVALHGNKTTGTGANVDYKDLVFLPYEVPAGWQTDIDNFRISAMWPNLPALALQGDCLDVSSSSDDGTAYVIGRVRRSKQLFAAGENNYRELEVELTEHISVS